MKICFNWNFAVFFSPQNGASFLDNISWWQHIYHIVHSPSQIFCIGWILINKLCDELRKANFLKMIYKVTNRWWYTFKTADIVPFFFFKNLMIFLPTHFIHIKNKGGRVFWILYFPCINSFELWTLLKRTLAML